MHAEVTEAINEFYEGANDRVIDDSSGSDVYTTALHPSQII